MSMATGRRASWPHSRICADTEIASCWRRWRQVFSESQSWACRLVAPQWPLCRVVSEATLQKGRRVPAKREYGGSWRSLSRGEVERK